MQALQLEKPHAFRVIDIPEPAAPGIETVTYTQLHQVLPRAQWLLLASCRVTSSSRSLLD